MGNVNENEEREPIVDSDYAEKIVAESEREVNTVGGLFFARQAFYSLHSKLRVPSTLWLPRPSLASTTTMIRA